jgi:hypothetical protein
MTSFLESRIPKEISLKTPLNSFSLRTDLKSALTSLGIVWLGCKCSFFHVMLLNAPHPSAPKMIESCLLLLAILKIFRIVFFVMHMYFFLEIFLSTLFSRTSMPAAEIMPKRIGFFQRGNPSFLVPRKNCTLGE